MNNLTVVKEPQGRGQPKKARQVYDIQAILKPKATGKTFKQAYGRSMQQAEGLSYVVHFLKTPMLTRDWESVANYCGVHRATVWTWRKEAYQHITMQPAEIRMEMDAQHKAALDKAAEILNEPLPLNALPMELEMARKVRLDAARTIAKVAVGYTSFAEKWGLKDVAMVPPPPEAPAGVEVVDAGMQEQIVTEVLKEFEERVLSKSKKPEGV